MKRFLLAAFLCSLAAGLFAEEPQIATRSHAQSGYDYADITVVVSASPADAGRMWLNARYGYPLLLSEADDLSNLVQSAAKKVDIAIANKSTISYRKEIGRFRTAGAAFVSVLFETSGYSQSYVVVQLNSEEKNVTLLLNHKDTQDFIRLLGNAHGLFDEYQKQVALFK
jgi:hypothetical protein